MPVTDPLFWLVLSLLFVTVSLTIVLVVAIPTFRELSRAARSAEKLFDTLRREFPPTLQAIRLTGLEISDLTEDVSEGVQSAGQVVKQVDQSLTGVRQQAQRVQYSTRSVVVGIKAAWRAFTRSPKSTQSRRGSDRLSTVRPETEFSSSSYDGESLSDTLPETTRNPRRAMSQEAMSQEDSLNQPLTRNPDRSREPGDPSNSDPHNSERAISTPSPRRVERSRSFPSNQSNDNAAIPDPASHATEADAVDYRD